MVDVSNSLVFKILNALTAYIIQNQSFKFVVIVSKIINMKLKVLFIKTGKLCSPNHNLFFNFFVLDTSKQIGPIWICCNFHLSYVHENSHNTL